MILISPLVGRGVGRRGILLIPFISLLASLPLAALLDAGTGLLGKKGIVLAGTGVAIFLLLTAASYIVSNLLVSLYRRVLLNLTGARQ